MEIFTYHTIYPFQVCSLVVLSSCTVITTFNVKIYFTLPPKTAPYVYILAVSKMHPHLVPSLGNYLSTFNLYRFIDFPVLGIL